MGNALSVFTTILNRLQKSSPRSPRFGNTISSVLPLKIGVDDANLTSLAVGRTNAGWIGVMGGCNGCGELGTELDKLLGDPGGSLFNVFTSMSGRGTWIWAIC